MDTKILEKILLELKENNKQLKKSASLRYSFLRGLIAGLASVIGGTLLVTLILALLSWLQIFPVIGNWASDFLNFIHSNYQ